MNEAQAEKSYALLDGRIDELEWLSQRHAFDLDFLHWRAEVGLILRKTFGNDSVEHAGFMRINFEPVMSNYSRPDAFRTGLTEAKVYLDTIMTQLGWFEGKDDESRAATNISVSADRLAQILDRFHAVVLALGVRSRERRPVTVVDEYDVQYVLRALLAVEFSDVRPEEYTPSHAGAAARVDFLLKRERVIVEAKMTRAGLADRKIGEELSVDIERYRKHSDCSALYCLVYDPEHRLQNPVGLEQDLSRTDTLPVSVFVRPRR